MSATSEQIRREVTETLRLSLVGPDNSHTFARELLPEPPTRWYLTGFLVAKGAPLDERSDPTSFEEIDAAVDASATDDANPPERASARRTVLPSSLGLSVLVRTEESTLKVVVSWGDYAPESLTKKEGESEKAAAQPEAEATAPPPDQQEDDSHYGYRRLPEERVIDLVLPRADEKASAVEVPDSGGLSLYVTVRHVAAENYVADHLPKGVKSVVVFLVNERTYEKRPQGRGSSVFQATLRLESPHGFVARPDLRGSVTSGAGDEWDERIADLHYRDVWEYVVGHGVSARAVRGEDTSCRIVESVWIPQAEVERVAQTKLADVVLGMEALAALESFDAAKAALTPLVHQYRDWISAQEKKIDGLSKRQRETAKQLLTEARAAATRIEAGIGAINDAKVFEAFRIANRMMAIAGGRREAMTRGIKPVDVEAPTWHPFQLGFFLMTLRGISEPAHAEREIVDLLFFPTGGGKTEAYLGLAAFTLVLRRLRAPGIESSGVSVLMRYTLRLLTLDQLSRAAALVCALELERQKDPTKLGAWPFEIGLWVGSAATPNRMGKRGYKGPSPDSTAYMVTRRFKMSSKNNRAPLPIENCPWCGTKFGADSFRLVPNELQPINLLVHCENLKCDFHGDRALPIVGVDEPIYQRLPGFIIATVDKFAALPWIAETGALFGKVDRYDKFGFYGAASEKSATPLPNGALPPPDLIIQDELHLISGPLGTIAGVYETAIDCLASREVEGHTIRPKIIASTATVRRAERQIRALFERDQVMIFPPPGPDRRDSFFAHTEPASAESPARLYIGIAAQGRSLKVVFLRAALALLSAAQTAYKREGGKRPNNPADSYMTLLGYFNSLRELGGTLRIVEDEVHSRLQTYGSRKRLEPAEQLLSDRNIDYEVLELTSRVATNDVASAKRRLAVAFSDAEHVDVALATNMISVGLDIVRLGLMVLLGQPKTSAEYIQATSRVGRDPKRPALVVTLLNVHKPRDRSHYERFEAYHGSFYRSVEPTSVTPFSPRALDRALVGSLVALSRHGDARLTPAQGAGKIVDARSAIDKFAERFADRAVNHDRDLSSEDADRLRQHVVARCRSLLDDWVNVADRYKETNARLRYQRYEGSGGSPLLHDFLDPELSTLHARHRRFRANRSMRDVEESVDVRIKTLNDW